MITVLVTAFKLPPISDDLEVSTAMRLMIPPISRAVELSSSESPISSSSLVNSSFFSAADSFLFKALA
ncbi:hypothetical protein WICPIJ_006664 [Wickerhamomyces pijperi]|uniref:Uncharacterized protein n=2 Tax=Saccharomycotina TaxID=147537 RepID=A0A9P8P6C2_9ASCO|nr:uncharacterized protein OGAPHI_004234 [Ogataea philodendri]KAH3666045.1 hypothetical protein OGAPHI_004234 [Ogataea philodendri]KAH3682369.1 hypothetical protein WICPIJ_006664 [Wickerhamomyces pijperi]